MAAARRRVWRPRSAVLALVAALSLLGQGERCRVDPRFHSPSSTLITYWDALRKNDAEDVWECYVEGRNDLPFPGMLWFMPPTRELWLEGFRSLPVTGGRLLVTYEVHYVARGASDERVFRTGCEMVRMRGEWRIMRPIGEVSMPEWTPNPRPVDI